MKRRGADMFYNRGRGKTCGFALLFIGAGMLLSTLLTWGWFMMALGVILMIIGIYLACCC